MKKIVVAFSAIISIMVFIASPMFVRPVSVYAEGEVNQGQYYTITELAQLSSYISDFNYIYFNIDWEDDFGNMRYYSECINLSDISLYNISFENNILSIARNSTDLQCRYTYYESSNTYSVGKSNNPIYFITFDFNEMLVKFETNNHTYYLTAVSSGGNPEEGWYPFDNFDTDLDLGIDLGMQVAVDFTPDLENSVVRGNISDNGVNSSSKFFSMDITNNSDFGIQYFFTIQEYPTSYTNLNEYAPHPATGFANNTHTGQVYANEEWIYTHPVYANGIVKVLKASHWHYLGAGETYHQNFSWAQFNIEKGKQYQALVIAVPNRIGCASALNTYYDYAFNSNQDISPYVLDFSEAETVYFSFFSVVNPAVYDSTDNNFGNYISSGDKNDSAFYQTKAYEDPSTGQLVISDKSTAGQDFASVVGAPVSGGSHGGGGYYTGSSFSSGASYNSSGNSFSSLNGHFGSFFGFISTILGYFPNSYQLMIMVGISGLVCIGILKAAIK